jgi:biopolymer transport protein TolQ
MPPLSDADVIEAVRRASVRVAALVHQEIKRGLNSLATIASIAPLVGLFGTVREMVNSFKGCGGERSACMAAVADGLSTSFVPAALGLLVAIPAVWCYNYLTSEMEALDMEMQNASVELVNSLVIHLRRRNEPAP